MPKIQYPIIEPDGRGYKVRISAGAFLPGIYLNYIMAQKAALKFMGQKVEAAAKRKKA